MRHPATLKTMPIPANYYYIINRLTIPLHIRPYNHITGFCDLICSFENGNNNFDAAAYRCNEQLFTNSTWPNKNTYIYRVKVRNC